MKLGFAGLGLMGLPMATNLLRSGQQIAVYNRSLAPRQQLAGLGAIPFDDPASFFAACDRVILMLRDDQAVDEVLGRGMAEFADRAGGKLIINMGTHSPAWSKQLERDVVAAGGRFVEAPVSGSRGPAERGELIVMVAGDAATVERARPILAPMCREIVDTGAVPSAMACKLAVNLYLIASVATLAEAARLAVGLRLDLGIFARVISSGPLGSEVARAKLGKMVSGDFSPQAAIHDVCKNARLVADAAVDAGLNAGLLASARDRFERLLEAGGAELDMAAIFQVEG